jgi:hypothetical protein
MAGFVSVQRTRRRLTRLGPVVRLRDCPRVRASVRASVTCQPTGGTRQSAEIVCGNRRMTMRAPVLRVCGRAPAHAPVPVPGRTVSMRGAWVGPLHWTSGLGETAAPFPAGVGTAREVGEASRAGNLSARPPAPCGSCLAAGAATGPCGVPSVPPEPSVSVRESRFRIRRGASGCPASVHAMNTARRYRARAEGAVRARQLTAVRSYLAESHRSVVRCRTRSPEEYASRSPLRSAGTRSGSSRSLYGSRVRIQAHP